MHRRDTDDALPMQAEWRQLAMRTSVLYACLSVCPKRRAAIVLLNIYICQTSSHQYGVATLAIITGLSISKQARRAAGNHNELSTSTKPQDKRSHPIIRGGAKKR